VWVWGDRGLARAIARLLNLGVLPGNKVQLGATVHHAIETVHVVRRVAGSDVSRAHALKINGLGEVTVQLGPQCFSLLLDYLLDRGDLAGGAHSRLDRFGFVLALDVGVEIGAGALGVQQRMVKL
jgi:hypothetical protein